MGLAAYSRGLQARLPPAHGTLHLRTLVESLALVRGELAEGDHQRRGSLSAVDSQAPEPGGVANRLGGDRRDTGGD